MLYFSLYSICYKNLGYHGFGVRLAMVSAANWRIGIARRRACRGRFTDDG